MTTSPPEDPLDDAATEDPRVPKRSDATTKESTELGGAAPAVGPEEDRSS